MLLDDVNDPADVLGLLPAHSDGSPLGHVLMTAQQRGQWPAEANISSWHSVGVLSTDEAFQLLSSGGPKGAVKAEVLADEALGVMTFVEEELGYLALGVALLKKALGGLDGARAAEVTLPQIHVMMIVVTIER